MTENQKNMIVNVGLCTLVAYSAFHIGVKCGLTATAPCPGRDNYLSKKVAPKAELLPADTPGVYFGEAYGISERYVGKPLSRDGHVLVVGQTGSCKTASIVNPTMETAWAGFNVYFDVKGELVERHRALHGADTQKKCLVFNPYDGNQHNCYYDPFALMKREPALLADHAFQLAKALIAELPNDHNQVWTETATAYTAGVIIDSFTAGMSFVETMERINSCSVKEVTESIMAEDGSPLAKNFISKLDAMDEKTIAGIGMELVNNLALFTASPAFRNAFEPSEEKTLLDWNNLNTGVPFDTILALPEEKLGVLSPMYRLMVTQMITSLACRERRSYNMDDIPPVLVVLDEMAQLGRIPVLDHALATLRCRGVTLMLFIQSLASLEAIYGEPAARSIRENCEYKVILGSTDVDSQDYLARLVGTTTVRRESTGRSVSASLGISFSASRNCSEERENVVQPHAFHILKDAILYAPDGVFRIKKHPVFGENSVFDKPKGVLG